MKKKFELMLTASQAQDVLVALAFLPVEYATLKKFDKAHEMMEVSENFANQVRTAYPLGAEPKGPSRDSLQP